MYLESHCCGEIPNVFWAAQENKEDQNMIVANSKKVQISSNKEVWDHVASLRQEEKKKEEEEAMIGPIQLF